MDTALLIAFREALEAELIISIVSAVYKSLTIRIQVPINPSFQAMGMRFVSLHLNKISL